MCDATYDLLADYDRHVDWLVYNQIMNIILVKHDEANALGHCRFIRGLSGRLHYTTICFETS